MPQPVLAAQWGAKGTKTGGCYAQVVGYLYASAGAYKLVKADPTRAGRQNFVGYVAVEREERDVGKGHDVVVVWRGTITKDEWIQVECMPLCRWTVMPTTMPASFWQGFGTLTSLSIDTTM